MWPLPSKLATTSSARAWSRSTAMTFAPVVANASATALPMPPVAPVTMTPLPSRPAPTLQLTARPPRSRPAGSPELRAHRSRVRQHLLAPIPLDHVLDDVDADAGLRRRQHVAALVLEGLGDQLVLHRVAQRLELEELRRRRAEADREARGRADGARPRVRVRLAAVELDALGRLLEAGDALGAARVDADDIHR